MKQLRLVALVLAATWCCASVALACDEEKGTSASAAGAKGSCSAHSTSATAASMEKGAGCAMHGTAAEAACAEHKSRNAAAAAKGAGASCCMGTAGAMAAGARCDTKAMHGADCAVCSDEATCDDELRASGVRSQLVSLRNGAMIVYTADSPVAVRALQTKVARYNDHIMSAYQTASQANLCGECKSMRGAMASGKYTRELVNVRNGCQILLTSSDRSVVRKIHDMTGAQMAVRVRD